MESLPQIPEFRNNPENFLPCIMRNISVKLFKESEVKEMSFKDSSIFSTGGHFAIYENNFYEIILNLDQWFYLCFLCRRHYKEHFCEII